jgi:predicted nucleotidyltransferase
MGEKTDDNLYADNKILNKIKNIILFEFELNNLPIENIILFGSRARGDNNSQSDWDFLITVRNDISRMIKNKIILNIQRACAEFGESVDIIIKNDKNIANESNNVGYLVYYAVKEGIRL